MKYRFFDILAFMSTKNKIGMLVALLLMLLSSIAELITIASVVPFISVVVSGELPDIELVNKLPLDLISESENRGLIFTILFVFSIFVSGTIRLFYLWYQIRLNAAIGFDLASRIYLNLLRQSYSVYLKYHSSDFLAGISKADSVIGAYIGPIFSIINGSFLFLAVFTGLYLVDSSLTLAATACFTFLYVVIFVVLRVRLKKNAEVVTKNLTRKLRSVQEAFAGYKEIFIYGLQKTFLSEFKIIDWDWRLAQSSTAFLSSSPRLMIETIGLILIAFASLVYLGADSSSTSLAVLGAFALGAQRILPAVQLIYSGFANMRGGSGYLRDTLELLNLPISDRSLRGSTINNVRFERSIVLSDLGYALGEKWLFTDLTIKIPVGSFVGIVGPTGCGKTTLLEVLMGLRSPSSGSIEIDGLKLDDDSIPGWHSQIALVPQEVHLFKGTVLANIAMSDSVDVVGIHLVNRCVEQACLKDDIESLELGLQTVIGEGGVKLSGGQRQRLGVARALFRRSTILFLDEATSNLDEFTEQNLIGGILENDQRLTVFMIAHRLKSLVYCDLVLSIEATGVRQFKTIDEYLESRV